MAGLNRRGVLVGGVAGLLMLGTTGCGYVLYPGRRGRTGGRVDLPVLVIDLLWLIPGLLPGLICLVVDFASGCIYEGGESASTSAAKRLPVAATVQVELDGEIVASGRVLPDRTVPLRWSRVVDGDTLRARARVVVRTDDGALAQAGASQLLAAA